jgi:hypothetical protein
MKQPNNIEEEIKNLKKALKLVWMMASYSNDLIEEEERKWLLEYFKQNET